MKGIIVLLACATLVIGPRVSAEQAVQAEAENAYRLDGQQANKNAAPFQRDVTEVR